MKIVITKNKDNFNVLENANPDNIIHYDTLINKINNNNFRGLSLWLKFLILIRVF